MAATPLGLEELNGELRPAERDDDLPGDAHADPRLDAGAARGAEAGRPRHRPRDGDAPARMQVETAAGGAAVGSLKGTRGADPASGRDTHLAVRLGGVRPHRAAA